MNCTPSYNFQLSFSSKAQIHKRKFLLIESLLDQGIIVSSPDHEGPNGEFAAGVLSGQITLDSIRAVLKSGSFTGL